MNRHASVLAVGLALICGGGISLSARETQSNQVVPETDRWTARLEGLRPDNPMAYFDLGEEVADLAQNEKEHELAWRLFALAGLLDTPRLGRSACLALADIETEIHIKRRLLAMASLLSGTGGRSGGGTGGGSGGGLLGRGDEGGFSESTALSVTEAFSYYRRGLGSRALSQLRKPGAQEMLKSLGHLLRGGSARFLEDCKLYNGRVKPTLTEFHLVNMLTVELAILSGPERSWASELLLSRGRPLIEIESDRLDQVFGVDPSRCVYRGGRWVQP